MTAPNRGTSEALTYATFTTGEGQAVSVIRTLVGKKWFLESDGLRVPVTVGDAATAVVEHHGSWHAGRDHGDSFDNHMIELLDLGASADKNAVEVAPSA